MSELARILLAEFDRLTESRGYASRSEAFRDLIRAELNAEQTHDARVVGTLTKQVAAKGVLQGRLTFSV